MPKNEQSISSKDTEENSLSICVYKSRNTEIKTDKGREEGKRRQRGRKTRQRDRETEQAHAPLVTRASSGANPSMWSASFCRKE